MSKEEEQKKYDVVKNMHLPPCYQANQIQCNKILTLVNFTLIVVLGTATVFNKTEMNKLWTVMYQRTRSHYTVDHEAKDKAELERRFSIIETQLDILKEKERDAKNSKAN